MFNNVTLQFKQHEKETYIANRVIDKLLFENCTQDEYRYILKMVEQRILGYTKVCMRVWNVMIGGSPIILI